MLEHSISIQQSLFIYLALMLSNLEAIDSLQLAVTLILILATVIVYHRLLKPYRTYSFYRTLLTSHYRTQINPFTFLGIANLRQKQQDLQKYNDSHHYAKSQLTKYQVRLMKVGSDIVIDLIEPALIEEFYNKVKDKYYQKNLRQPSITSLLQISGQGLFLSEGDSWKKKKKILSNVFNFQFIHSQIKPIASITIELLKDIENRPQNVGKETLTVNLANLFQRIFGTVVIQCFFGNAKLDKIGNEDLFEYVQTLMELNRRRWQSSLAFLLGKNFYKFGLRSIDRQVNKRGATFKEFSANIIKKIMEDVSHSKQGSTQNGKAGIIELIIRQNLLCDQQETQKLKSHYTMDQLISQVATFFIAGTETTSTMTTMLVYELSARPQILEKARKQIKAVLGSKVLTQIDESMLKQCTYLDCLLRQTLRMHSPVSVIGLREALKDHYLGEIPIRKGVQVTAKIVTNHYKEEFFQNPKQFRPERWINVQVHKLPLFSYFPFSAGMRVCIGQQLSLLQAKIALIGLLSRIKEIKLQKPNFKRLQRAVYGPQAMVTYLTKDQE